mmetsp:Transcript_18701/g.36687  ORF Transcript_18701/g.36687 Transcript_18701/m.36687 type:complete len:105 (-) Transcript_18701:166-480(-)
MAEPWLLVPLGLPPGAAATSSPMPTVIEGEADSITLVPAKAEGPPLNRDGCTFGKLIIRPCYLQSLSSHYSSCCVGKSLAAALLRLTPSHGRGSCCQGTTLGLQ